MAHQPTLTSRPHPNQPPPSSVAGHHPRRRLAHESVSLRHVPASNTSGKATSKAPTASSLANHNGSPATSSNSQAWFDTSNNNVELRKTSPIDHDPPFFLPDSSSGTTPHNSNSRGAPSLPQSALLNVGPWRREGLEGQLDDFRSVIDDLTIQNKKLMKRIRRYERNSTDSMSRDRLFEVKFHKLPEKKKRELEDTLKRFALTLNDVSSSGGSSEVNMPPVAPKASSSLTSTKFDDSGYGSMSTSTRPAAHRFSANPVTSAQSTGAEASRARDRSIHSYLHDIPEGLLPQESPAVMTDEAKKRVVVARLEQLFQGSGAARDGHSQPLQQQEVSQLAATADRKEQEARGQRAMVEGTREARIMQDMIEASNNDPSKKNGSSTTGPNAVVLPNLDVGSVNEQRPTRPLDLDPHRAQDPVENVGYIRHLGFLVPDPSPAIAGEGNQGWIYLNLLINMAQLHTLNVSTGLVKDALRTYSSKFELSDDGRKIRWHPNAAKPILDRIDFEDETSSSSALGQRSRGGRSDYSIHGRKRSRSQYLDHSSTSNSSAVRQSKSKRQSMSGETSSKMSFTPVRTRSDNKNTDTSAEQWVHGEDMSEALLPSVAEYPDDSPMNPMDRMQSATSQSSSSHGEGALVFYNNPQFFLDLSGSRAVDDRTLSQARYRVVNTEPLGSQPPQLKHDDSGKSSAYSPAQIPPSISGSLEVNTDSSDSSQYKLQVDDAENAGLDSNGTPLPIPFEASGVGYVYPSDNFVLYVRRDCGPATRFSTLDKESTVSTKRPASSQAPAKKTRVMSVRHRKLDPSDLPPATYAVSPDDDDAASDSDEEDDEMDVDVSSISSSSSSASESSGSHEPEEDGHFNGSSSSSAAGGLASSKPSADARATFAAADSGRTSSYEELDNQSVDFLATAREIDPAAIRAREREYDAELAERLAEEIPAGSSAATRGGGSGFNSPARARRGPAATANAEETKEEEEEEEDAEVDSNAQQRSVSS